MKTLAKFMTGAAAAALVSVTLAAPAQAQYGRYDRYDRYGRGSSVIGDIITGIAVAGGIAAVTSAISRDGSLFGYGNRYRYRDDYRNAVNSCGYEAERNGRGRVSITDIDRRGNYSYRVRGVIDADYGTFGSGYGGYDRYDRYGSYDRSDRYDRYDRYNRYDRYDRYDRYGRSDGYGRYQGYSNAGRLAFTCTARGDGRVTDFRINDGYRW